MNEHQIRLSCGPEFWQRYQNARGRGLITDASGLGKLALAYGMEHGQPAAEALIRGNGQVAEVNQDLDAEQLVVRVLDQLEQLVADGVDNVKRCVIQCTAVVVLVLLAVGMAICLRPSTSTA